MPVLSQRNYQRAEEILASDASSPGEKLIVEWQCGMLAGFTRTLMEAIAKADDKNLGRLASAFADEVAGFLAWSRGNLAQRLRDAGLDI
jgi:hypothetical protein